MAKRMAEQMELFEPVERGFDEGGLMDEGGTVDPVSGNDVPPGSTQEEVRDDIPAQLSEGEFVFPADVVRYIGLENLMRMRQEAKQGLAQMEAMGQMGNGDEATMPDDLPFDMYDLDVDDEEEYNSDELKMQQGGMVPSYDPRTGTYSMPGTGMGGFQPAQQVPNTGFTPYTGTQPYIQPLQYTGTQYTTADQTTNIPTFGSMVGSGYQGSELRTYVNDAGQVLQIPFVDGKPVYPIPEGYKPIGDQPKEEAPTTVTPTVGQAQVRDDGGRDDITPTPTTTSTTLGKVGTSLFGPSTAYNKAKAKLSMNQFGSISPIAALGSTILGLAEPKTKAIMGNIARDTAINNFGFDSLDNATTEQLDAIGYTMDAAMNLSVENTSLLQALQSKTGLKAGAPTAATISKSAATIADSLIGAYKDGDLSLEDLKNISEVEIDKESGAWKDPKAVKDYVDAVLSQELKDIEQGLVGTSKESGLTAQEKRDRRSQEIRQEIDRGTYGFDKDDPSDTGGSVDIGGGKTSTGAEGTGGLGPGGMGGTESSSTGKDSYGDSGDSATGASSPSDRGGGSGSSNDAGSDPDDGSNPICLTEDMKVKLNGVIDFVTNVKVGDIIDNTVVTEVLHKHMREGYYVVNGELKITNDHPVLANGSWKRTEDLVLGDYINSVEVTSLEYVDQVTPTVYIGTADDRYDVYTEGEVYTVHGQYKNITKQAA